MTGEEYYKERMEGTKVRSVGKDLITFEDGGDFPTPVKRNAQGYPLLEDGTIDWERTSKEKEEVRAQTERKLFGKQRKQNTHLTPPKKKRKR
jgi:hypothetical protein